MARKQHKAELVLLGVGVPHHLKASIPVTFLDPDQKGAHVTLIVDGLRVSDVTGDNVTPEMAQRAIDTIQSIVNCWSAYIDDVIDRHMNDAE